jgi:hypothetical protein
VVQSWKHELIRKKKHWNARKTKLFILKKERKNQKKANSSYICGKKLRMIGRNVLRCSNMIYFGNLKT